MRLLFPRRGRRRSLRRLASTVALLIAAGCGGEGDAPSKRAERTSAPPTRVVEPGGELAVGITEPNPNLFRDGELPEPFASRRDELIALAPAIYRLTIDWAALQPTEGPPDFDQQQNGCMRTIEPCAAWNGLRDQLKALAQRQRDGGWQALVVPLRTPAWAAAPASGCERSGTEPRNRPVRAGLEDRFTSFIESVLALAKREGAELRYWSPWNEPNHPYFISPQRVSCERDAGTASTEPYARLARALDEALDRAPGDQELVLGELAGLTEQKTRYTNVSEFTRALPRDVVCAAAIWGQHLYVGGADPLEDLTEALSTHRCKRTPEIWITETGARGRDAGACRAMREALLHWYEDPRVTAAVQYTFREDDGFPVGLVSTDLSKVFPALEEWKAWGGSKRPDPADAPPESACGA